MNKNDFLKLLRTELQDLPADEVNEIIRDQEEFIREAMSAGREEEQVIQSLGSPRDFAKNVKAQQQIDRAHSEPQLTKQMSGTLKAVMAILVLAPFNLIFFLGPFLGVAGMTFGVWAAALASLMLLTLLFIAFCLSWLFLSGSVWVHLSTFFSLLGGIGLSLLVLIGVYYFTKFLVRMTLSYLSWNLKFIQEKA